MSLFSDILFESHLITEAADVTNINDAINNLLTATIRYNDGNGVQGERVICPVAYGMSTKGNPVVRAFQVSGPSKSGHRPNWRLFKVANIETWDNNLTKKYNPKNLVGLNTDDDAQMSTIYTIAKIGSAKKIQTLKNKGITGALKSTPTTKQDVTGETKTEREEYVDNQNYTAYNAIDDILRTSGNAELIDKNIDNQGENNYINKKNNLEAPETKPTLQSDVPGGDKQATEKRNPDTENMPSTTEPVKKKDLQSIKDISDNFNDMMERMDNVNNDEED